MENHKRPSGSGMMKNNTTKYSFYIGLSTKGFEDEEMLISPNVLRFVVGDALKGVTNGYNMVDGFGYWEGQREPCVIVSFLNIAEANAADIMNAAEQIRADLRQEAVLVEKQSVNYRMVGGEEQ
jgi:hypothetical protein